MSVMALSRQPGVERLIERVRRTARSFRMRDEQAERRRLVSRLPRKPELSNVMDQKSGYAILPAGSLDGVETAAAFARQYRDEHRNDVAKKKADYNPTILEVKCYEDAPAIVDFVLSDNVLQVAADYLGEIPVLMGIKLWCTPPNQEAGKLKGSQMYHRDGQRWLLRRVKYLINMDQVDSECGPFTFLPADISERLSNSIGSIKEQGRVKDDVVFRTAKPTDTISLIGPAGTAAAVDSSRCFHCGARVQKGERLLLQFHFLPRADALHGGALRRTPAFTARYGDDPIRNLVMPRRSEHFVEHPDD
ncbi:MAG: hypothetical protein AB7V13_27665 [Pseudorhodoplanes sp.]|uniref:hypothetical protein n=1 Tax=Pseudorhodoplanes sp. TaxID=1934341 RepID=UPI003D0B80C2